MVEARGERTCTLESRNNSTLYTRKSGGDPSFIDTIALLLPHPKCNNNNKQPHCK